MPRADQLAIEHEHDCTRDPTSLEQKVESFPALT